YDVVDGLVLIPSSMILSESSGSSEEVRKMIFGISLEENGIGYLPRGFCYVNRISGPWQIRLWISSPLGKAILETPFESDGLSNK
ncbi:UNVERIFIED_CONTAM: hypothetical protein Sindi_2641500, partial [Sesamum indicum]